MKTKNIIEQIINNKCLGIQIPIINFLDLEMIHITGLNIMRIRGSNLYIQKIFQVIS